MRPAASNTLARRRPPDSCPSTPATALTPAPPVGSDGRPRSKAPARPAVRLLLAIVVLLPATSSAENSPRIGADRIILHTAAGDILLALYPEVAPKHVRQVLNLVRRGVYDSTHFFRVVPGFHIQISSADDRWVPLTADQRAALRPLRAEFGSVPHRRGTLSMARDPSLPDSAVSSFSILLDDWPDGDGRYTIFGHVESGMEVIDEFLHVPRDEQDRPALRLVVTAEVVNEINLAARVLAPARSLEVSPDARSGVPSVVLGGMVLMTLVGLISFALTGRFPRAAPSLHLLNVLIGSFLILACLVRDARAHPDLAVILFVGLLAMFRLLSGFEKAEPKA